MLALACSTDPSFQGDGSGGKGGEGSSVAGSSTAGSTGGASGSGASGGTEAGSGGGGAPSCVEDDECTAEPCFVPVCVNADCSTELEPAGTPCGVDKKCNGFGQCVDCLTAADCPAPGECATAACVGGQCSLLPNPAGSYCNGGADQCDGNGACVECVDNGGCGECCVCDSGVCKPV